MRTSLFPLGNTVATPGAVVVLEEQGIEPASLLARHQAGDWGDLCQEDAEANRQALEEGDRLLSSYRAGARKVWIITEADRSVTTILLPEDY